MNLKFKVFNLKTNANLFKNFELQISNYSGFSLFETLLVLGLSSVVGVVLVAMFIQNNGVSNNQHLKSAQGLTVNDIYSQITHHFRNASAIINQYPTTDPQYITDADTIVIQLPSINSSGAVIPSVFDHLIITVDSQNSKILRAITIPDAQSARPSGNQVLATNLQTLLFYYLDTNNGPTSPTNASSINFVVNLTSAQGQTAVESSSSGVINLRNN